MKPPRWMADGTEPTDAEVAGLVGADPALRAVAEATEPSEAEVARLLATVPAPARRRLSPAWTLLPLAAAALAWWAARPIEPPNPAVEAPIVVAAADWSATGGRWEEVPAAAGTRIRQTEGTVRYEVGPREVGAGFVVEARDVEVAVVGTRFDVTIDGDEVRVEVLEGIVEVRHAGRTVRLAPSERWARPAPPVAVVEAPPPAPRPPPPPPAPAPPPDDGVERLSALFARVEAGERTPELREALLAWSAGREGPLAEAAAAAAVEVGAAALPPREAVAALDAHLAAHPDNPRRLALLELRADLLRDGLRDCAAAIPTYRALAEEADGPRRARAEAWWGLCAAALGEPEAAGALARALEHGVAPPLRDAVARALAGLELRE